MASIAESNIEDPVTPRSNSNDSWIFSHFPKYGKGNTLPRIGFHSISEAHPQVTLGSTNSRTEADIQATLVVRRGKKYDYDNDGENEEEENLIHYLKDQVLTEIEDNQTQLRNLEDVNYVIPAGTTVRKPEGKNVIFMAQTFEARIDDC
jgi:hypothetical protein